MKSVAKKISIFYIIFSVVFFILFHLALFLGADFYYSDLIKIALYVILFFSVVFLLAFHDKKIIKLIKSWRYFNQIIFYSKIIFALLLILKIIGYFLSSINPTIDLLLDNQLTFGLAIMLGIFLAWIYAEPNKKITNKHLSKKIINFENTVLFIIILLAIINIFDNLGRYEIYGDEHWHLQVINSIDHGYGSRLWNFITNKPMMPVIDGRIINYSEYLITKLFGFNNFNLRVVPAIFALLTLPLIYIIFKEVFNKNIAILTCLGFSTSQTYLYLGRFLRPYSIFLFIYLLIFWLLIYIFKNFSFLLLRKRKFFSILALVVVLSSIAIEERSIGKILFALIPFCFIVVFFLQPHKKIVAKPKLIFLLLILSIIFLLFFFLATFFQLFNFSKTYYQLISMFNVGQNNFIYYFYVFEQNIKIPFIFYLTFIIGIFTLTSKSIKGNFAYAIVLIFTLIPMVSIFHLLTKSIDAKYTYLIIPFVFAVSYFGLQELIKIFIKTKNESYIFLLMLTISLIAINYLVLPLKDIPYLSQKSPGRWERTEAKTYSTNKRVAPEYEKAFSWINQHQQKNDVVVMTDGYWYLETKPRVDYYFMQPWYNTSLVIDFKDFNMETWSKQLNDPANNEKSLDFFNLINRKKGLRLIFVASYTQMIDYTVIQYLIKYCHNQSEDLGIIQYYPYNTKEKRPDYWPNVFICNL